jgi:RNA polymerase sigma-70 factor (sigma-E family)
MGELAPVTTVTAFAAAHRLELLRFAYLLCGDRHRAEDLVQDVLTAMWRRFGDRLAVVSPLAYARRALVNAHTSWHRRRSSTERAGGLRLVDEPAVAPPADPDPLWDALGRLPERQRAVLVLRYYTDLPDAEIAAVLGVRLGTVSSAVHRGLAALRSQLADPKDAT